MADDITPRAGPMSMVDASVLPWFDVGTQALLDWQRTQFGLLFAWQQAIVAVQKELWDEWVSHWGGGVPIDA